MYTYQIHFRTESGKLQTTVKGEHAEDAVENAVRNYSTQGVTKSDVVFIKEV